MKTYTTTDIYRMLGIKRERIKNWISAGYIKPSIKVGSGPGTKHLFSNNDIIRIKRYKMLLDYGFSRNRAYWIVQNWHPEQKHIYLPMSDDGIGY